MVAAGASGHEKGYGNVSRDSLPAGVVGQFGGVPAHVVHLVGASTFGSAASRLDNHLIFAPLTPEQTKAPADAMTTVADHLCQHPEFLNPS